MLSWGYLDGCICMCILFESVLVCFMENYMLDKVRVMYFLKCKVGEKIKYFNLVFLIFFFYGGR